MGNLPLAHGKMGTQDRLGYSTVIFDGNVASRALDDLVDKDKLPLSWNAIGENPNMHINNNLATIAIYLATEGLGGFEAQGKVIGNDESGHTMIYAQNGPRRIRHVDKNGIVSYEEGTNVNDKEKKMYVVVLPDTRLNGKEYAEGQTLPVFTVTTSRKEPEYANPPQELAEALTGLGYNRKDIQVIYDVFTNRDTGLAREETVRRGDVNSGYPDYQPTRMEDVEPPAPRGQTDRRKGGSPLTRWFGNRTR